MKHKQLIDELLELNEYERLGQSWFLKNGKNMDYSHIMPSYATYNNEFLQSKDFFSEGKELEIGFNPRFFLDALKAVDDEEVYIEFGTNRSPCIIKPIENEEFLYMIMPMRLK